MKKFLQVPYESKMITIATDKIVWVNKSQNGFAIVYLQGPLNAGMGISLTLAESYETFIDRLDK